MYKDPDKQREANRKASKRYRRIQGMTVAIEDVIPKTDIRVIPKQGVTPNLGQAGTPDLGQAGTQGGSATKMLKILGDEAKVSPVLLTYASNVKPSAPPILEPKPKRGKDIKVFADLPSHVQETINMMSTTDGKLDKTIKANRTAIAINYQHQFPDRYHSTGVAI